MKSVYFAHWISSACGSNIEFTLVAATLLTCSAIAQFLKPAGAHVSKEQKSLQASDYKIL